MIGLVFAQLRGRWGQALTLLLLSMAVTAAAVSGPAFAIAVDRAAVAREVSTADDTDLTVLLPPLSAAAPDTGNGMVQPPDEFTAYADARAMLTGFTPVTSAQIQVQGLGRGSDVWVPYKLIARDGFCRHVTFRDGRCPVGSREAALPAGLAHEVRLAAGDAMRLTPARETEQGVVPDGPPVTMTLVGIFEPNDPGGLYWSLEDPLGKLGTPAVLTNPTALKSLVHRHEINFLDAIPPTGLITADRIPQIRSDLDAAQRRLTEDDPNTGGLLTGLPTLLDRIDSQNDQARKLLPIAAAPLIVLCWFVIYLAVGHGVWGRRHEVGVVVVRGARWPTRAIAVSVETLLPLLAGLPAGLAIARLLVAMTAPTSAGVVGLDRNQLLAAGIAAVGTLAAALVAVRRELAAPAVQLLRQVPPRPRRVVAAAAEVLVVVLGIVAVIELRGFDAELVGTMVAAPAALLLAAAVVGTLAVKPLLDLAGRRSLRRGRIGPAVAALYLARRPGSVRLLVVLVLVLGAVGFGAAATDVAAQGRVAQAEQELGAARVLEVQNVDRAELMRAVRTADPGGRYAMAAVSAPNEAGGPPVVAIDSTRLSRVALWTGGTDAPAPADVAALLRPAAPRPLLVRDGELTAGLRPDPLTGDGSLTVSLLLTEPTGDEPTVASFPPLRSGVSEYRTKVAGCPHTCRLAGISVSSTDTFATQVGLTMTGLRQDGRDVLTRQQLADDSRWRPSDDGIITEQLSFNGSKDGLQLNQFGPEPGNDYDIRSVDTPYPLPAVTAGDVPDKLLRNIDGGQIPYVARAHLPSLPGVGVEGALIDLGYAERLTHEPGSATLPRVWLAADTPDRIVDRLRHQGLDITGERRVGAVLASLDESAPAMALRFYRLATGVAVLVALGALALFVATDRRTWSPGLRGLRTQGMTDRATTVAAIWSYGGMVVAGAVTGVFAGAAAWFAAGRQMPLGVDSALLTSWPRWDQMLMAWAAVLAVLFLGAAAAVWWQRHAIREQSEAGG